MFYVKINDDYVQCRDEDDLKNSLYSRSQSITLLTTLDVLDKISTPIKEGKRWRTRTPDGTLVQYDPAYNPERKK